MYSIDATSCLHSLEFYNFIGDFNVNWLDEKEKIPLYYLYV